MLILTKEDGFLLNRFNSLYASTRVACTGDSEVKAPACNVGDLGSIPGLGRFPGEGNGNPLQYSSLENHGQRSLVGYSPWGRKEPDRTERLHFPFHFHASTRSKKKSPMSQPSSCSHESNT